MNTNTASSYDQQAESFLAKHGIKFRATLSDSKQASWEHSGHHYRITLSRNVNHYCPLKSRITFDFWGSLNDLNQGKKEVSAYDVLACISSDVNCAETFKDFCADFGYEEDSIKALQAFRRCSKFAARLRDFFTKQEIEELSEIQ